MSKRFKSQDYFRYKRLGKRWRRPVGWQSKMRLGKGGAGLVPGIGYGTEGKMTATLVRSAKDFEKDCRYGVIFAGSLGAKKVGELTAIAKEKGITILNMKKVKRAKKIAGAIEAKKTHKKEHSAHEESHAKKHDGHEHEHKEGHAHEHKAEKKHSRKKE